MPVPSSITSLSTTAASNSPAGSESPSTSDDYLRALSAFIAQIRAVIGGTPDGNIPSEWATDADVAAAIAAGVVNASETVRGIIELATTAESSAGTDTVRAVTPAGLAARTPAASETVSGLVELATIAEAQAGTDTVRAVTPAGLAAAVPVDAKCTAWVNFNGSGVVAIRDSYNVSSITDNGTGDYTVNFGTAMANANYSPAGWVRDTGTTRAASMCSSSTDIKTTSAFQMHAVQDNGTAIDSTEISVIIFGGQ